MKRLLLICALLITTAGFAKSINLSEYNILSTENSDSSGAEIIRSFFEDGRFVKSQKGLLLPKAYKKNYANLYDRGDFVIMWALGSKDEAMTKDEYTQMWRIMKYLSDLRFRVILNIETSVEELKDAAERGTTSVILVSAHGNTSGFYDFNVNLVPYDIFSNKSKSLYQVIISACYGDDFISNYDIPNDLLVWRWGGLTTTKDLMDFLVGDKWDALKHVE